MRYRVTKLEAATGQLDFAIRVMLNDGDVVVARSVCANAMIVAHDLASHAGHQVFADAAQPSFPFGRHATYHAMAREVSNFFKHADRPGETTPDAAISFESNDTEGMACAAALDLRTLRPLLPIESAFLVWSLAKSLSRLQIAPDFRAALEKYLPALGGKPPAEQLEVARAFVRRVEAADMEPDLAALIQFFAQVPA